MVRTNAQAPHPPCSAACPRFPTQPNPAQQERYVLTRGRGLCATSRGTSTACGCFRYDKDTTMLDIGQAQDVSSQHPRHALLRDIKGR